MKANKISLKVVAIVLIVVLSAGFCAVAYAFFTSDFVKNLLGKIDDGQKTVVNVGSYDELFAASVGNGGTGIFNDGNPVSQKSDRTVITLTNDVTLQNSLTVTADAHLNLNGKTLYLNGHNLAFVHGYHGTVRVYNGTIVTDNEPAEGKTASSGKIYFVTPNASAATGGVTFANRANTALDVADCCVDLSNSDSAIAFCALQVVTNKLANVTDGLVQTPSYDDLSAKTDTAFSAEELLYSKNCFAGGAAEEHPCVFAFKDLDLPTHIYAMDGVTVSYSSSDSSVLTDGGKISPVASQIKTANLTVTVKKNGVTIGQTTLCVHVASDQSADQILLYGKTAAYGAMAKFFSQTENKYVFARSLQLPTRIAAGSTFVTLSYAAYENEALTNEVANVVSSVSDSVCLIEPTSAVQYLAVKVNGTETLKFNVLASDAGLIRTQASYAQDFVIQNYGGSIVLGRTNSENEPIPTFQFQKLYTPATGNAHTSITKIEYSIINDTNSLYELKGCASPLDRNAVDGELHVAESKNPLNFVQTVQLNCKFYFDGTVETVEIQIPVRCDGEQSGNVNKFLPYYNEYDRMFFTTTSCYTTKTFEMPFASGDGSSDFVVCYDMLSVSQNDTGETVYTWNALKGISVSLYYNGTAHPLTPTTGEYHTYANYVNALNAHLDTVGSTKLAAIKKILAYGDSKWVFTVKTSGADALIAQNQEFEFVYNYRNVANDNFQRYDNQAELPIGTSFTLPGILIFGGTYQNSVSDENMYKWMYYTFSNETASNETAAYSAQSVVLTDWLKQNKNVDVTTGNGLTYLAKATDLNGLQYVTGATYVNLSGMNLASSYATNIGYVCSMSSVETLILTNCNLGGDSSSTSPEDAVLANLSKIKNLTELNLGNESGVTTNRNKIFSFKFLTDIPSLNKAYVYNNLDSSTVDGVFYGSLGLVNMEYFSELTSAGVTVYDRKGDGAALVFSQTSDINDFKTLQAIEYQKKLVKGQSITVAYEQFVGITQSDLGLNTSYTVGTGTYSATGTITFGYDGDENTATSFYARYNLTLRSGSTYYNVVIKVVFDVVRVAAEVTA